MIAFDEDALICDLAETYGIYDYQALPPLTVAVLAAGLRENSRIMQKLSDVKVTTEEALLSSILDGINTLAWMQSKDGNRNRNRPKSVAKELVKKKPDNSIIRFDSPDDFRRAWNGN